MLPFASRQVRSASSKTPKVLAEFLHQFPVITKIRVQWGEMDAFQHVNNCQFFKYQEVSRLQYCSHILKDIKEKDTHCEHHTMIEGFMSGKGIGPILGETQCRYRSPVSYPDLILVGAKVEAEDLLDNRFTIRHNIWSLKDQKCVSDGSVIVVVIDYRTGRPVQIPPVMLESMRSVASKNSLHLLDTLNLISEMGIEEGGDFL